MKIIIEAKGKLITRNEESKKTFCNPKKISLALLTEKTEKQIEEKLERFFDNPQTKRQFIFLALQTCHHVSIVRPDIKYFCY
jgi:hypothetical protein